MDFYNYIPCGIENHNMHNQITIEIEHLQFGTPL